MICKATSIPVPTLPGDNHLMFRSRQPPLPTSVRPVFRLLRAIGALFGILSLAGSAVALSNGFWLPALAFLLLGLAIAIAPWVNPLSPWQFIVLTVPIFIVAGLLRVWWLALLPFFVLGFLWLAGRRVPGIQADQFRVVEPDTIMENAEGLVGEFESLGYRQVAAIKAPIRRVEVVVSLMLSADAFSYASVTDAIMAITSVFGDDRTLVTRNSGLAAMPPWMLSNVSSGASPSELVESHARALDLVGEQAGEPRLLDAHELAEVAMRNERTHASWTTRNPRPLLWQTRVTPLSESPDARDVIQTWSETSPEV